MLTVIQCAASKTRTLAFSPALEARAFYNYRLAVCTVYNSKRVVIIIALPATRVTNIKGDYFKLNGDEEYHGDTLFFFVCH